MLSQNQIQSLSKANLSKDIAKSKKRMLDSFQSASKEQKNEIVTISGLTRSAFYNAFKFGSASPKAVISMAQVLDISPFYFTGETENKGKCGEDELQSFIANHNISITKASKQKKQTKSSKPTTAKRESNEKTANKSVEKTRKAVAEKIKNAADKAVKSNKEPATPAAPQSKNTNSRQSEITISVAFDNSDRMRKAVAELDEESAVLLFRAIIKKAKAGGNNEKLLEIIKRCLLY